MATSAELPRDFERWLGPWYIGQVSWVDDAHQLLEHDRWPLLEQDRWLRPYQERSHCGTPGCCEMRSVKYGPAISEPRLVPMGDSDD